MSSILTSLIFLLLLFSNVYSFQYADHEIPVRVHQIRRINSSNGFYLAAKNAEIARKALELTEQDFQSSYLEYCKRMDFIPLSDVKSHFSDSYDIELYIAALERYVNEPEIKDNYRNHFFKSIEFELYRKKELREKFIEFFVRENGYITSTSDYVKYYTRAREPNTSFSEISEILLENTEIQEIFRENSYYPEYCIQDTNFIFSYIYHLKEHSPQLYLSIATGLRRHGLLFYRQLLTIMEGYKEALSWLELAIEFFRKEQWFFEPDRKRFYSLNDIISSYWSFLLPRFPEIKINVINSYNPVIREKYNFDLSWTRLIFRGLNKKSRNYLRTYDPETRFNMMKNITYDINNEEVMEMKSVIENEHPNAYLIPGENQFPDTTVNNLMIDLNCGITIEKFITSYACIVSRLIIRSSTKSWKEIKTENHEEIFFNGDSCIVEGIAELSNYVFLRKLYQLYPYLNHNRMTRFYLYSQLYNFENKLTGFLWAKTIYDITGGTFKNTFNLVKNYDFNLNSLLTSQEIKDAAEKFSPEKSIITIARAYPQKPQFSILPYMDILLVNRLPVVKKIEYYPIN